MLLRVNASILLFAVILITSCNDVSNSNGPDVQVDEITFMYCIGNEVEDSVNVQGIDSAEVNPFILNNTSSWYEVNYSNLFNTITPTRDFGTPNKIIGMVSGNNLDLSTIVLEYGYTSQMQKDTLDFYQSGDPIIIENNYGCHYYKDESNNIEYSLFIAPLNMYMFTLHGGTIYCHVLQDGEKVVSEKMYVLTME